MSLKYESFMCDLEKTFGNSCGQFKFTLVNNYIMVPILNFEVRYLQKLLIENY